MSLFVYIPAHAAGDLCPACLIAPLKIRNGKFGRFLGCSRYPKCKYTCNKIKKKTNKFFKNGHISRKNKRFIYEARRLEDEHSKFIYENIVN